MNELLSANYLTPASIVKAAESSNISVPELLDKAAEAYEGFVNNSVHQLMVADSDGMDKQAMEKLAYMDKQAFIFSLGTAAALASIPFSLWSGYDLARNAWGGAKDVMHGRFGKALKRAPAMAFDAMGVLPGVGVATKIPKLYKALKSAKAGKGIQGLYRAEQLAAHSRKLRGAKEAIKKLEAGKSSWYNPFTWTEGSRAKRLAKLKDFTGAKYKATEAAAKKAVTEAWGADAAKKTKWVQGDIGWGRALGLKKSAPKAADIHDRIKVFDILHSPKAHKFYQHADPLDGMSMIRMAPLIPLVGGAVTGLQGLRNTGAKGLDYLNYYGEEEPYAAAQARSATKAAARSAGYIAGYYNGS